MSRRLLECLVKQSQQLLTIFVYASYVDEPIEQVKLSFLRYSVNIGKTITNFVVFRGKSDKSCLYKYAKFIP